jgi:flagellar secretion chaperone FliS
MSYASLNAYRAVGAHSQVAAADSRQLIAVMFETALTRLATARGCMERGEVAAKGENIGKAIGIIGGLNESLDLQQGGQIANNLRELYDYSCRRLTEANLRNDTQGLDEISSLLREIKSAWDALPQ